MKRIIIRLASFVFTLIIGIFIANLHFHDKPMVLTQINSSEIRLTANEPTKDAQKYYEEGVAYYSQPIPYDPLTDEQKQNQKMKPAVESFKRAIRLKPDYYEAYLHLGFSYDGLKNYGLALEAYKEAARLKPDEWLPYYMIGQTYSDIHRYWEAITFYIEANDIYSNSVGEPHTGIIKSLGIAYLEDGDRKSALEQYKILKKVCKKDGDCRGTLDEFEYFLRQR